jgi:hypothetical protein
MKDVADLIKKIGDIDLNRKILTTPQNANRTSGIRISEIGVYHFSPPVSYPA